jgi:hypothetical protein
VSTYQNAELAALDQIEDLLEAYAESRLSPRSPILARLRSAVMHEAAAVAAIRAIEHRRAEARPVAPPRGRMGFPRITLAQVARPAFAFGFAGILALGIGATVSAAPPGSAFYNTRVALEAMFLPTEIDARLASHEEHLDARLAEAEKAAAAGDAAALAAALAAYQVEIEQTLADVGNDFGRLSHFQAVLEKHVAMLTALSLRLPTEVARQNAVEHAIEASQTAVTKVREQKAHAENRPSAPTRRPPVPEGRP